MSNAWLLTGYGLMFCGVAAFMWYIGSANGRGGFSVLKQRRKSKGLPTGVSIKTFQSHRSEPPIAEFLFGRKSFRNLDSLVHRTALILEVTRPVTTLHRSDYFVSYVNSEGAVAASLFREGHASVLWPPLLIHQLPYADLSFDVVVINITASSIAALSGELPVAVNEAVRILMPTGTLVFLGPPTDLPSFPLHPLMQPSQVPNVFKRVEKPVPELPVCRWCGIQFPQVGHLSLVRVDTGVCQPPLVGNWTKPTPYISLHDSTRMKQILSNPALSLGRFRACPVTNTFDPKSWMALRPRYVGPIAEKSEWIPALSNLVRTGRVRSLLDAGAGTCTLYGVLLQEGLLEKLRPYMAFGAYNCAMLRFCAERGAISFQYNWVNRLPFCKECRFDLVFQAEGMHHVEKRYLHTTFTNFDAVLACQGFLFLSDGGDWHRTFVSWVNEKNYTIVYQKRGDYLVKKVCRV